MNNNDCISKCYEPFEKKLHPLYLIPISSKKPFCLTNNKPYSKQCEKNNYQNTSDIDFYIPRIGFDEEYILKNVYNINNWNDVKTYIEKNYKSNKLTINRILTFSWTVLYDTHRTNIDIIANTYEIYLKNFYKKSNSDITKILFGLKNLKLKYYQIQKYLVKKLLE